MLSDLWRALTWPPSNGEPGTGVGMGMQEALGHLLLALPEWVHVAWRIISPGFIVVAAYFWWRYIAALGLLLLPCVLAILAGFRVQHRTWPLVATCTAASLLGAAVGLPTLLALGVLQQMLSALLALLLVAGLHHSLVCRCDLARLMQQRWLHVAMVTGCVALWWLGLEPARRLGMYHAALRRAMGLGLAPEGVVRRAAAAAAAAAAAPRRPLLGLGTVAVLLLRGAVTPALLRFAVTWLEDYRMCLSAGGPASLTIAQAGMFSAANRYDLDWLLLRFFVFVGVLCCTGSIRLATTSNVALHGLFMLLRMVASNRHLLQLFREETAAGTVAAEAASAAVAAASGRAAGTGAARGGTGPAQQRQTRVLAAVSAVQAQTASPPQLWQLPVFVQDRSPVASGRTSRRPGPAGLPGRPQPHTAMEHVRIRPVVIRPEDLEQAPAPAVQPAAASGQSVAMQPAAAAGQSVAADMQQQAGAVASSQPARVPFLETAGSSVVAAQVPETARASVAHQSDPVLPQPGPPQPQTAPLESQMEPPLQQESPRGSLVEWVAREEERARRELTEERARWNLSVRGELQLQRLPANGGICFSDSSELGSCAAAAAAAKREAAGCVSGEGPSPHGVKDGPVVAESSGSGVAEAGSDAAPPALGGSNGGLATPVVDNPPTESEELGGVSEASATTCSVSTGVVAAGAKADAGVSAAEAALEGGVSPGVGLGELVVEVEAGDHADLPVAADRVTGYLLPADAAGTAAALPAEPAATSEAPFSPLVAPLHAAAPMSVRVLPASGAPASSADDGSCTGDGGGDGGGASAVQQGPYSAADSSAMSPRLTAESVAAPASPVQFRSTTSPVASPDGSLSVDATDPLQVGSGEEDTRAAGSEAPQAARSTDAAVPGATDRPADAHSPHAGLGGGRSARRAAAPPLAAEAADAEGASPAAAADAEASGSATSGSSSGSDGAALPDWRGVEALSATASGPTTSAAATAPASVGAPALMRFVGRQPPVDSDAGAGSSVRGQRPAVRGADSRTRGGAARGGGRWPTPSGGVGRFDGRGAAAAQSAVPGAAAAADRRGPRPPARLGPAAAPVRPTGTDGASGSRTGFPLRGRPGAVAGSCEARGSRGHGAAATTRPPPTSGTSMPMPPDLVASVAAVASGGGGIGRFGGRGMGLPAPSVSPGPLQSNPSETYRITMVLRAPEQRGGGTARAATRADNGAIPSGGDMRGAPLPAPTAPAAAAAATTTAAGATAAARVRPQLVMVYLRGGLFDEVVWAFTALVLAQWALHMPPWAGSTAAVDRLMGPLAPSWQLGWVSVLIAAAIGVQLLRLSQAGQLRKALRPCGGAGRTVDVRAYLLFNLGLMVAPLVSRLLGALWEPLAFAHLALATNLELAARVVMVLLQPIRYVGPLPLSGLPLLPLVGMALFRPSAMQPIPLWPCVSGMSDRARGAPAAWTAAALGLDPALSEWLGLLLACARLRMSRRRASVSRRSGIKRRLAEMVGRLAGQGAERLGLLAAYSRRAARGAGRGRASLALLAVAMSGGAAAAGAAARGAAAMEAQARVEDEDEDDLDGPGSLMDLEGLEGLLLQASEAAEAESRRRLSLRADSEGAAGAGTRNRSADGTGGGDGSGSGTNASVGAGASGAQHRAASAAGNDNVSDAWTITSSSDEGDGNDSDDEHSNDDGGQGGSSYNLALAKAALRRRVTARRTGASQPAGAAA